MDSRCQKFTSVSISNNMLDMMNYRENLLGLKILENSCGEGNILCLVVERYITDSINQGYTIDTIVQGLENDIYGAEIVKETYDICISKLNTVAAKYSIFNVKWKVINGDVLKKPFNIKFDFVIGNPPYISYRNLESDAREFIKTNYETCKMGKPDYCYAFIENAIDYLADKGMMVFLIPNSIFKNVFAKKLREVIQDHVVKIFDYPNYNLFDNALTSSAIMMLQKNSDLHILDYVNVSQNIKYKINKELLGKKWMFCDKFSISDNEKIRFDQLFRASITIATQKNNVFVINEETRNKYKIEKNVLRKAISPRNKMYGTKEYIIFPYRIKNQSILKYSELEFIQKFPNAYQYLKMHKEELDKRAADKNAKWFEYGRSQAIHNMNQKKLLVSTVVTNKIKVYEVNQREIPYSGIYIISNHDYELEYAKKILESDAFLKYVNNIGTPASGSSLRITSDDINDFLFKVGEFING